MIFRQLLDDRLSAASYLLGCVATGEAAVVDPGLPAEQYAMLAADTGLRITKIFETHMHADYFSTGRALAALTGARIYAPRLAEVQFDHEPLDDGATEAVGNLIIKALHTTGHTPEHMAYAVSDTPRAERPWFVLTGDTLFVGDVGRADLVDLPMTGAEYLYTSITEKLLSLPDDTEVYPGHYGGSACGGKSMSGKVASTIGFERAYNWVLQAPDQIEFCERVGNQERKAVASVLVHRNTNRGELPLPPGYGAPLASAIVPALTVQQAAELQAAGALLIDLRAPVDFAAGHPAGAVNVFFRKSALAGWVAAIGAPDDQLILIADQPFIARSAAQLLAAEGRNPILGAVAGSVADWAAAGLPLDELPLRSLAELHDHGRAQDALILDVREPDEWAEGVIAGAQLIRLDEVRAQLDSVPTDRLIVTTCGSGTRASIAASLLRQYGFTQVANVAPEGMPEYSRRYPTVQPTSPAVA